MIGKESKWYVAYITRHHETMAFNWIKAQGVEAMLPTRSVERKWSDRVKTIIEPWFPSYIFLKVSCREYFSILEHPSIIKYVSFGRVPAIVPDAQVALIRRVMAYNINCEIVPSNFKTGMAVQITQGILSGTKGEIVYGGSRKRFMIRIDSIGRSILFNIPAEYISNRRDL